MPRISIIASASVVSLLVSATANAGPGKPDVHVQQAEVVVITEAPAEMSVAELDERRSVGGWGGLTLGVTQINNGPATLFGFAGGVQFNERFTVGVAGEGIASWARADAGLFDDKANRDDDVELFEGRQSDHFIEGGWGGLHLAFEPFSRWPVHPIASATFGVGAITYSQRTNEDGWDDDWDVHADVETEEDRPVGIFGVTDVAAGASVNLARWCRLDGEVSYRWVSGLEDFEGVDDDEMSGLGFGLSLRFGAF